jgi:ferredoxin-thioredoxin reductase catalytic subunit
MLRLNDVGIRLSSMPDVHAMTDVTGFGLLGHLLELCDGAGLGAELRYDAIPMLSDLAHYVSAGALAKGLKENWKSYGHRISSLKEPVRSILSDPQTSGGILFAVSEDAKEKVIALLKEEGLDEHTTPIARMVSRQDAEPVIAVKGHEDVPVIELRFGIDAPRLNISGKKEESLERLECAPPRPAKGTPSEMWKMMKGFFKDAWVYRSELKKQDNWIRKYAKQKGLTVNPHWMFYTNLRLWLVESEAAFGKRYCPCFEPSDNEQLNRKLICPCEFIESDIAEKKTCHCTLFGRGDLTDEDFKEAEARLMREYRVELTHRDGMVYTADIPTDPARGLKVPDAYHLAKRNILLHGLPSEVYVERDFEALNIQRWARFREMSASMEKHEEGYRVKITKQKGESSGE